MKIPACLVLLLSPMMVLSAAQIPVGNVADNLSFAVRNGNKFDNASFNDYEGKILMIMMMTPWCPTCQSNASAVGDGLLDFFYASSRGTLRGKNANGIPIVNILLSTEEAEAWDGVNTSFASTNGYADWGLDATAARTNPRKLLGYFRGGFIASTDLHDWGNDRRRLVVLNMVRNSESHSYREIVINQNAYSASDNTAARAAINAIRPMAAVVAPVITTHPIATTINSGGTAMLRVAASGTSPTFQWYVGASGVTTSPVNGATSSTYTTPALTSNRTYWARAVNASGNDDSSAATVTVIPPVVTTSFAQWQTVYAFPPAESAANDDPDRDGAENLLEYFHGTHPLQTGSSYRGPTFSRAASILKLTYRRAKNISGYTLEHRYSNDLKTWQVIPEASLSYAIADRGTYDDVTVTLPASTSQARYYRLGVAIP